MHLYWHGQTCVKVQESGADAVTVAIDPYKHSKSIKSPRMAADILMLTSKQFENAASSVSGDPFMIDGPGEFEVKNIFISGLAGNGNKHNAAQTFYYFFIDEISIAHLGRINKDSMSDKQLQIIENVDVLLIPVGGDDAVNAKQAAQLVNQIEPKIVIPMYYNISGQKNDLDSLDKFTKQMGIKAETTDKLLLKSKDIPQDEMKLIVVEPQI